MTAFDRVIAHTAWFDAKPPSLPAAADTMMKLRAKKKDFARKAAESQSKI